MSEALSVPFLILIKLWHTKALEWLSLVPGSKAKYSSSEIMNLTSFTVAIMNLQLSSFAQSCPTLCDPMDCSVPGCPSPTPGVYSNSCPLSQWCHPTISSSVIPFSTHLQFFLASGSFQMSQFFASHGQNIRISSSASVLPMNAQDWFPLQWTGWISLLPKGLSSVFSNTTIQKHQFFGAQLSLQCNSYIHTWPMEKS